MANTTIDQLASLTGTLVANTDLFLVYDASANIEKNITAAEMKNVIGNGPLTITTSAITDALVITSTDAGATAAPDIVFYRNSASPAVNDAIGNIVFRGKNSVAVDKSYAGIFTNIIDPTNAVEAGIITLHTMNTGTLTERMRIRHDGNMGIGSGGSISSSLMIAKNITGATTSYGVLSSGIVQSDVTVAAAMFSTSAGIAADSTITNINHYAAAQGTFGANTSLTSQTGFVSSSNLIGATTNYGFLASAIGAANVTTGKTAYGFFSNNPIATGGGSSWNFFAGGTAPNYFSGNVGIGQFNPTAKLHVTGQIAGGYTEHAAGTVAMALGTNTVVKVTPNAAATYTTTVAPAGSRASIIVVTSGTTSHTITFGTGFKTTGTLATGVTSARAFVLEFVSDGLTMVEASRTVAMA